MEKQIRVFLLVFLIVFSILAISFLVYQIAIQDLLKLKTRNIDSENKLDNSGNANIPNEINNKKIFLSMQEIAKHNSSDNCWMVIDNKVYDFTSYLDIHPGGIETMLYYCGQDGTDAFNAEGHPPDTLSLHASYYIGELNQSPNPILSFVPDLN